MSWFAELAAAENERRGAVEVEVTRLRAEGARTAFVYLCAREDGEACVLAEVYAVEKSRLAYLRRYTLPRSVNVDRSTDEARAAHTEDGQNHWAARVVDLGAIDGWGEEVDIVAGERGAAWFTVQCRHTFAELDPAQMIVDADSHLDHRRLPRIAAGAHGERW